MAGKKGNSRVNSDSEGKFGKNSEGNFKNGLGKIRGCCDSRNIPIRFLSHQEYRGQPFVGGIGVCHRGALTE